MIAADTSSVRRYLSGIVAPDTIAVARAVANNELRLPPIVVTECLSDPKIPEAVENAVQRFPRLLLTEGYWVRAGRLRRDLKARERKAGVADCLIAQSCIDHGIPLITFDTDFRHFTELGLQLT